MHFDLVNQIVARRCSNSPAPKRRARNRSQRLAADLFVAKPSVGERRLGAHRERALWGFGPHLNGIVVFARLRANCEGRIVE